MKMVAGVDEAGRGCVIGPLVVAGTLFHEEVVDELAAMGVRDSKKLTPRKREALEPQIKEMAHRWGVFELQPRAIDVVVNRGVVLRKLNYLEAMAMAKVIRDLSPDVAIVDPADVVVDRYVRQIKRVLPSSVEVHSENKADDKFPVVSAASIVAKVRRDEIIRGLREEYGDFGSGYCSDRKTVRFLKSWFEENEVCPHFIRGSWATVKRIRART